MTPLGGTNVSHHITRESQRNVDDIAMQGYDTVVIFITFYISIIDSIKMKINQTYLQMMNAITPRRRAKETQTHPAIMPTS